MFGVALSAAQCEGGYLEKGKGLSIIDTFELGYRDFTTIPNRPVQDKFYPTHKAVDFYSNYESDIALMKELGAECLRTSIAWSRIFPKGDELIPNEEGLRFYDKVIDLLLESNIQPIITMSHLEIPYGIVEKYGGWDNKEVIECFNRYSKAILTRYHKKVRYWITFNEINMVMHFPAHLGVNIHKSNHPKQIQYQAMHNMLVANAYAIQFAKSLSDEIQIGAMNAHTPIYPYTCKPEDVYQSYQIEREVYLISDTMIRGAYPYYANSIWNENNVKISITEEERKLIQENTIDFLAISYYCSNATSVEAQKEYTSGNLFGGVKNPYLKQTEWGWQIDSLGLRLTLNRLYDRYQIPIMVVENGIGMKDIVCNHQIEDDYRIDYLKSHLLEVEHAIQDGVEIMAYTMWSFLDIVSASSGQMTKRYGLVYVDVDDEGNGSYKRMKKSSYNRYKEYLKNRK